MAKRRRRSRLLSSASIESLQAEIQRRQSSTSKLHKARERLASKLAKIDDQIRLAGGSVSSTSRDSGGGAAARGGRRRGGRRSKGGMSLVEALVKVLTGKTMGVTEAGVAAKKSGYKTNAKTYRTMVNQALLKHKDKFKKVERGQYTAS